MQQWRKQSQFLSSAVPTSYKSMLRLAFQEGKGKDDTSIGPFTDKWLILSIMGAGRGKGKEQGQVVVNLAHYAAVHNEARQGFTVAVTDKKITQSLGEIVLEVTIGCV